MGSVTVACCRQDDDDSPCEGTLTYATDGALLGDLVAQSCEHPVTPVILFCSRLDAETALNSESQTAA